MKRIVLSILCGWFILLPSVMYAAPPTKFAWNANTEPDLAGYRLYICAKSIGQAACKKGVGIKAADIAAPTTETSIPPNTEGWAFVTAYDTSGNESGESNVVFFDVKAPGAPGNLTVQ